MEAGKIVLDRRRFLALSGLAAASVAAPAAPAEALELGDPLRLVVDNRERGLRVLGARGEFVAARGAYYAPPVPFPHLPKHLVGALVASEDRRFYDHFGLDPLSLARGRWCGEASGLGRMAHPQLGRYALGACRSSTPPPAATASPRPATASGTGGSTRRA